MTGGAAAALGLADRFDGGEHTGALPGRLLRRRGTVLA